MVGGCAHTKSGKMFIVSCKASKALKKEMYYKANVCQDNSYIFS